MTSRTPPADPARALAADRDPAVFWPAWAQAVSGWLQARQVPARDAVVLLPFAQLLPPARLALARLGGWQPRIETTQTLSANLGPAALAADGDGDGDGGGPTGDATVDRLLADRLLRDLPWARAWRRRDRHAFDHALGALVATAHEALRAAQGQAPRRRAEGWAAARELLAPHTGPGATEQALARVAVEWAAQAAPPATDRLFDLRPSAWLVLVAGGADPLADALLAEADESGTPCWRMQLDAGDAEDPFDGPWPETAPQIVVADDAEDEALAAASTVVRAVAQGAQQIALVAEDRRAVRRVRALLERAGLAVDDETGWTLDTTRAGARVMAALRAARADASNDERLDWLKADLGEADGVAMMALERRWRRPDARDDAARPAAEALWQRESARLRPMQSTRRQALRRWQAALAEVLSSGPQASDWLQDPAARRAWQVLGLVMPGESPEWTTTPMDLAEFSAWCDHALGQTGYLPDPVHAVPRVVVTPLARAMLRPFDAVVVPGADEQHLGAPVTTPDLLSDAQRRGLGLPDRAAALARRAQAFAHLVARPGVTLLRRHRDGDEPLAASVWLARLALGRVRAGLAPVQEQAASAHLVARPVQPARPPAPTAPRAVPGSLSASAVEALRACPYRFFARAILRLAEDEELDAEPDKRAWGNVLHATLKRFHDTRMAPETPASECARLEALATEEAAALGMDAAAWLPFAAGLPAFAARYVAWLHTRDAAGWRYRDGELSCRRPTEALGGTTLQGRLDRVDIGPGGALALLDYKTGGVEGLKQKVRQPLEDTQLAFYALLLDDPAVGAAAYLALDERSGIVEVVHSGVADSARALHDGLAHDLVRLRGGATMPALGQGRVCDTCEARGLCRRDHWAGPGPDGAP